VERIRRAVIRHSGLDGIDHLGLGGALRRTGTVFRYGIHTWHHCRIWIICSRVRHYGSTSRSKSCSTVTWTRT
jgi:hypothetical protein